LDALQKITITIDKIPVESAYFRGYDDEMGRGLRQITEEMGMTQNISGGGELLTVG
jgi:hypothetical protein